VKVNTQVIRAIERENCHYLIEGMAVSTINGVYRIAVSKGYTGSLRLLLYRLNKGVSTWVELCAAPDPKKTEGQKRSQRKRRDEMTAVIAELDARKKAMGLA
jgi:hypothetical protein